MDVDSDSKSKCKIKKMSGLRYNRDLNKLKMKRFYMERLGFFCGAEQQWLLSESIKLKLLELNEKTKEEVSDSPAAKHIRQTSIRLVKEAQQVLEDFIELEKRCNMLMEKNVWKFLQIREKILRFKHMCSEYILKFQQTLTEMLPWIGVGGPKEAALAEILNKRHSSPFNSEVLKKWIRWKEREVYTVNFFTNMMINTKIVPSQYHVDRERHHADHVVCFVFTSLGASEPYLSALSHYLNRTNPDEPQDPHSDDVEKDQWFASKEITDEMRRKATLFRDFAEANKEKKNMKFLTVGLSDETLKGCSIYLYIKGFDVIKNFEPPSKPEAVTVSVVTHDSVTLKVSPPRFGADNEDLYSVEYRVRGHDAWQREKVSKGWNWPNLPPSSPSKWRFPTQQPSSRMPRAGPASNPEEVTVSGLRPGTEYEFRCRAETSAWVRPYSDVTGSVRTLPCCPPGKPHVKPHSSQISVSWGEPAELGPDVHIMSYVVEFAKTGNGLKEEDLVWKQVRSGCGKSVISGLQPETEYVVRVRCDCGVSGSSKESVSVSVRTTKQEYAGYPSDISGPQPLVPVQLSIMSYSQALLFPDLEAINAADVPCPKAKDNLPEHFKSNISVLSIDNTSESDDDDDDDYVAMLVSSANLRSSKVPHTYSQTFRAGGWGPSVASPTSPSERTTTQF